jgi:hypothetical protein
MTQITIEVSEELAQNLAPIRDRLPDILASALQEQHPILHETYRDVLKFLTSNPSPQNILDFRPTQATQERISELLEKNRADELLPAESTELDEYLHINDVLSLLKTQTFKNLKAAS